MLDDIKKRFEFPNAVIQSQAVGHLIAAVLKENVSSGKIRQASHQTPALNLLWDKCCSENVALRTACSEGLVALVAEKHAEFDYVLHGALNLIPSARHVHGLVKTICKLLQIQAIQLEKDGDEAVWNLYGIRLVSHQKNVRDIYQAGFSTFCKQIDLGKYRRDYLCSYRKWEMFLLPY